ncbi:MAG: alpha-galactosidase [Acidobacteria bacterium]|nr:alpha-galactosidase [Acidobacteriota bacterium]
MRFFDPTGLGKLGCEISSRTCCLAIVSVVSCFLYQARAAETELRNEALRVRIGADGSYLLAAGNKPPIIRASVGAEVDHHWLKSAEYPKHDLAESEFDGTLGHGRQATLTFAGLSNQPDLLYTIRLYTSRPFGEIRVQVQNHTGRTFEVQSLRSVDALGTAILDLQGNPSADRVLSDSFSEDWPPLRIYDLGQAPSGLHLAVGSQMIYNQESKDSLFLGALSADRLLTVLHLRARSGATAPAISAFTVDCTGTTEIMATNEESGVRQGPKDNLVELNLPVNDGESLSSEPLMFSAGPDYHAQLENYGVAIRQLHHIHVAEDNLLGWWSWTAFYMKITAGNTFTNALWLAQHLKDLGYNWFHFDFGYGYARGDYATPNATKFPQGMQPLTQRIAQLGLNIGIWTAPFEVGEFGSIYQNHKGWLVSNSRGEPIQVTTDEEVRSERVFALDCTNPAAQEFLRETYRTLVREWQVKYIKLDFMDTTAVEGYFYRPHTTALENIRIGLQVIRDAVGETVLLDKDGSPMLTPVGIVDEGRVSQDTGHTFERSKEAAPGIAARYYMHRNFFLNDPDAFTVSRQQIEERKIQAPLTLDEARVSIALAAVSGGMYEIGDDLPTLGADPDRLALVANTDLMRMAKLGRAALPIDLLSYRADDEQPSIFLLKEDARQSVLAVFNWTAKPSSHQFSFADLKLAARRPYRFTDIFDQQALPANGDSISLAQPGHSVRLLKIIDESVPAVPPSVSIQAPNHAKVGETIRFAITADATGVPALSSRWDFGDGTTEQGRQVVHCYTKAGNYSVHLSAEGVEGVPAEKQASITVSGTAEIGPPIRYQEQEKNNSR